MKIDLDELESVIDSRLSDLKARIAKLEQHQTRLQEQRAQVESLRQMVDQLFGALNLGEEELSNLSKSTEESSDERTKSEVQELAYLKAEKEGFAGSPEGHWIAAEKHLNQPPPEP